MKKLIAYVDGSFNINTSTYGAGIVFIYPDGTISEQSLSGSFMANMRNVAGEIVAATAAINKALDEKFDSLDIFHDYTGIGYWANGQWQAKNTFTQAYRDYVAQARGCIDINFFKVDAHSGDKYNERADQLAKMGAKNIQGDVLDG